MAFCRRQFLHEEHLTLIPNQKMNLESDLYFLKEHEINLSYKQAYDFKTKMFGSLKALVPIFKPLDRIVEVKQKVDDTLDMSKAVVAPVGHPDVAPNPGWERIMSQRCLCLC